MLPTLKSLWLFYIQHGFGHLNSGHQSKTFACKSCLPLNSFEDMEGEILVSLQSWIFATELNGFRVLHTGLIYSASG